MEIEKTREIIGKLYKKIFLVFPFSTCVDIAIIWLTTLGQPNVALDFDNKIDIEP